MNNNNLFLAVSVHETEWAGKWHLKKKYIYIFESFVVVILFYDLSDNEIISYFILIILFINQVIFNIGMHFPQCRE